MFIKRIISDNTELRTKITDFNIIDDYLKIVHTKLGELFYKNKIEEMKHYVKTM